MKYKIVLLLSFGLILIGLLSPVIILLLFYSGINISFIQNIYVSKWWSIILGVLILAVLINKVSIGLTLGSSLDEREYIVTLRSHYIAFIVTNILLLIYIIFFSTNAMFIAYFVLTFIYMIIFEGTRILSSRL